MNRPPKNINEPFFGAKKIFLSCMQGVGILVVTLLIYFFGLKMGYEEKEVRTLTFVTLIVSNIAVILCNRSWERSIFKILATRNSTVKWVVGGAIAFLALTLYVPFLRDMFQFQPVGILEILFCIVAGFISISWFEIYKVVKSKKTNLLG